MNVTALDIAKRFEGIKEVAGETAANPAIMAMLQLDTNWPSDDSVPWCSGFVNYIAWLLGLPRSKSLRARSWLRVGLPVEINEAKPGFDVVIIKRGKGEQPGPEVINAPGHVGFFAGMDGSKVLMYGGNQSDTVNISSYSRDDVLGIRRLYTE